MSETPETTRHDFEPGDAPHPMHTGPLCKVCGKPRSAPVHN